jgi:ABC-type amino acid transport substrate-binding protein
MLRQFLIVSALLTAASCTDFPKDTESTLQRIKTERTFRIGMISSASAPTADLKVQAFLQAVIKAARASPQVTQGEAEVLLPQLEEGKLDLVIGRFEKNSPWSSRITIGPPLRKLKEGKTEWRVAPAMRNGENAWIALIEREARNAAPEAQ